MLILTKMEKVLEFALKIDKYIQYESSIQNRITLSRLVEGEPGEDPEVDEELTAIVDPTVLIDYVRERLDEIGVGENEYETIMETKPRKARTNDGYPIRLWAVTWRFEPNRVMGPPEVVTYCKAVNEGRADVHWHHGLTITGRSPKYKAGSKFFVPGQRVINPKHKDPLARKYWFVTSYRSGGIGAWRVLRDDNKLCTFSKITAYEEPDEESEEDLYEDKDADGEIPGYKD